MQPGLVIARGTLLLVNVWANVEVLVALRRGETAGSPVLQLAVVWLIHFFGGWLVCRLYRSERRYARTMQNRGWTQRHSSHWDAPGEHPYLSSCGDVLGGD
jgi:ABC-type nickel/cobalt efflux system permease component RcnA